MSEFTCTSHDSEKVMYRVKSDGKYLNSRDLVDELGAWAVFSGRVLREF